MRKKRTTEGILISKVTDRIFRSSYSSITSTLLVKSQRIARCQGTCATGSYVALRTSVSTRPPFWLLGLNSSLPWAGLEPALGGLSNRCLCLIGLPRRSAPGRSRTCGLILRRDALFFRLSYRSSLDSEGI